MCGFMMKTFLRFDNTHVNFSYPDVIHGISVVTDMKYKHFYQMKPSDCANFGPIEKVKRGSARIP